MSRGRGEWTAIKRAHSANKGKERANKIQDDRRRATRRSNVLPRTRFSKRAAQNALLKTQYVLGQRCVWCVSGVCARLTL